jgi:hypothetical protein
VITARAEVGIGAHSPVSNETRSSTRVVADQDHAFDVVRQFPFDSEELLA